jgi:hypothetical protein
VSHAPCARCGAIVRDHDETGEPGRCLKCTGTVSEDRHPYRPLFVEVPADTELIRVGVLDCGSLFYMFKSLHTPTAPQVPRAPSGGETQA